MSAVSDLKRELRHRAEYHLRLAVQEELGRGQPSTTAPYRPKGDWLWRLLFVRVYRLIPWTTKERVMKTLGMTASGWRAPAREPGEPWRPPADLAQRRERAAGRES